MASRWRVGRVFLAGDAAHRQPPFLGQGMCQGVRDIANLVWKLDAVQKRRAGDALLDTYGAERAAHVRRLTTTIKRIVETICERDPARARQRDADLIAAAGGTVKSVPRQDLIPPLNCGLLSARAAVELLDDLHQRLCAHYQIPLHDLLREQRAPHQPAEISPSNTTDPPF